LTYSSEFDIRKAQAMCLHLEKVMHPFIVSDDLATYGFWFAYWNLRNTHRLTCGQSLWLIWVGHNYGRHRDKMLDNSIRVLTK
jgi:hypothetical protein